MRICRHGRATGVMMPDERADEFLESIKKGDDSGSINI
jgi:hypothetical protein